MAIKFAPYNKSTPFGVPDYATAAARDQAIASQNALGIAGLGVEGVKGIWGKDPYLKEGYQAVKEWWDKRQDVKDINKNIADAKAAASDSPEVLKKLKNLEPDITALNKKKFNTDPGAFTPGHNASTTQPKTAFNTPAATTTPNALSTQLRDGSAPISEAKGMFDTIGVNPNAAPTSLSTLANPTTGVVSDVAGGVPTDVASNSGGIPGLQYAGMGLNALDGDWGGVAKDALAMAGNFILPGSSLITGPLLDWTAPTQGNAEREAMSAQDAAQARKAGEQAKLLRQQRYA